MAIGSTAEFEDELKKNIERLFGNCRDHKGVLRSMARNLGVSGTDVIFEAAMEDGFYPDMPYPILHFHATLAQRIEEEKLPGILTGLNSLNTVISTGAFPSFGCFGYYAPLRQVYLSYRMPVNPMALDAALEDAQFYLGTLGEQLDLFADFILFLCDDPDRITIEAYMDYLDSIADLNDLQERFDYLGQLNAGEKPEKKTQPDPEEGAGKEAKPKKEAQPKKKAPRGKKNA
ncbi:MAG: hypothetical protein K6G83_03645 [Lachnospiraceae bacterium]|nr:hypothetical protein [Lachnospiraceae bacterium]